MAYTLRASVRGPNELARLAAALHRRDIRPTYVAYRDDPSDDTGTAVFVVADERAAHRARRALEGLVTVTGVRVDAPVAAFPPQEPRQAHRVRDAFARVYR